MFIVARFLPCLRQRRERHRLVKKVPDIVWGLDRLESANIIIKNAVAIMREDIGLMQASLNIIALKLDADGEQNTGAKKIFVPPRATDSSQLPTFVAAGLHSQLPTPVAGQTKLGHPIGAGAGSSTEATDL